MINFQFSWQTYCNGILPDNANGFVMVLEASGRDSAKSCVGTHSYVTTAHTPLLAIVPQNSCDGAYTYQIDGSEVKMLGNDNLHDPKFDGQQESTYLEDGFVIYDGSRTGVKINQRGCPYSLHVYPSQQMYDEYHTSMPVVITLCILSVFVFTAGMFYLYDRVVKQRNDLVISTAKQSSAIVQSLFPAADPSEFCLPTNG
jgi:hypothetical protein